MHRIVLPLAALFLVAACAPGPTVRLHDLYLYGEANERLSHFYGDEGEILHEGETLTLRRRGDDDAPLQGYAVDGALLIDGEPYLSAPLGPLERSAVTASRIPLTTDMQVRVQIDTEEIVYFDGSSFLLLLNEGEAGNQLRVVPRPLFNRLRGLGQLNAAEAAMLERVVREGGRPVVLAFLPEESLPPHAVDGLEDHRRTGVYVQREVGTDESAFRPSPTELNWDVMARGNQAIGFEGVTYELVTSEAQLLALWNRAHGSLLTVPALPRVDFQRETVVALFAGTKGTGGYGVSVEGVTEEGGELYLDVTFSSPPPGTITTQALTSPWVMVRVLRGGYEVAWLRDSATGDLIGAARAAF